MPFTPYHFGPGILAKATIPDRFSLAAYVLTEVAVDTEVLIRIAGQKRPVHGELHSLLGAVTTGVVVGLAVYIAGRYLIRAAPNLGSQRLVRSETSLKGTLSGGILSGVGASLLDALMHSDVEPFWPFVLGNELDGLVESNVLLAICVATGVIGGLILARRYITQRQDG
jgi:membrane-bound metal-dependent hydrolase YbcI (DUF457 family)